MKISMAEARDIALRVLDEAEAERAPWLQPKARQRLGLLLVWAAALAMLLLLGAAALGAEPGVGPRLQEVCVTIVKGQTDRGSGTIITRKVEGKTVNFVLTAEHVVDNLREVKDVITRDGAERKRITYKDAQILQELRQAGRTVGEIKIDARVVNVDQRYDLALLRLRKENFLPTSAEFYLDEAVPEPGTPVYHCASPAGSINAASLTSGIVAQIGRRIEEFGGAEGIYDQVTTPALPGSSGGMVALASDGRIVGVITLGLRGTDNFHYMVPVRRIREWAEKTDIKWLLDPKEKAPSEADIEKIPLENTSPGFGKQGPTPAPTEIQRMLPDETPVVEER